MADYEGSESPMKCGTCWYFDKTYGQCRLNGPAMTSLGSGWPSTSPEYWCGQWRDAAANRARA